VTVLDVGTGDGLVVGSHQVVLDPVLDLVDIHLTTPFQLLSNGGGNALTQGRIGLTDRLCRSAHCLGNQLGIEWCATSITFDHNRFHAFSPFKRPGYRLRLTLVWCPSPRLVLGANKFSRGLTSQG